MDILLAIILAILCMFVGFFFGRQIEKKAHQNPETFDGYIAIDYDNGQFNLFAGFNREPSNYLYNGQIVKMEVVDLTTKSQEKQSP